MKTSPWLRASVLATATGAICVAVGVTRRHVFAADSAVTWSQQIAPLVYNNCTTCHHPGGAGPFSLLTYQDARRWGAQIATVTSSRYMPPWLPEDGYGDFEDERRLSNDQIALISEWVRSGMQPGDLAQAPCCPNPPGTAVEECAAER
jgi:mono/diheme cytochrome c family protein